VKIIQVDPHDSRLVSDYLALPFRLYQDTPQWVPPLEPDARKVFNHRHPFYQRGEAVFLLAYQGKLPVGRLAVLNNHAYNEFNHEQTGFFYQFECEDSLEAAHGLFETGFAWACRQGLNKIVGPKGFTVFDGLGLLVKGFEHRPAFGLPYNLPYYPDLVEASGFISQGDLVSGYLSGQMDFPPRIHEAARRIQERRGIHVARFKNRREFSRMIPRLMDLYNASLGGTQGNTPLTQAEVKTLADQMLWFANPRLIKILMKEDQPVGFLVAYPDISEAVQRTRGKLFPLGWIDLLLETRRTKWININGAGIVEDYRGLGGTAILFSEMQKSVVEGNFDHADLVQIGVDNEKMQLELRRLGIDFYKTHRLYQKSLVP